jgi:hypothetical protein
MTINPHTKKGASLTTMISWSPITSMAMKSSKTLRMSSQHNTIQNKKEKVRQKRRKRKI